MLSFKHVWIGLSVLAINALPPASWHRTAEAADQTVIESTDKVSRITVPKGWKAIHELDNAVIQVALEGHEVYVIVLTNAKDDFENMTIAKFSELCRDGIVESLASVKKEDPVKLTINGRPALQQKIQGSSDGNNVVNLQTVVEGKKHFHEILAQAPAHCYERHKDALQQVIMSFQEQ